VTLAVGVGALDDLRDQRDSALARGAL
jgi:hypothetical protein